MIKTDFYKTRADGVSLYKTYSTEGYLIEKNGNEYLEAIDIEGNTDGYIETDKFPLEPEEETVEESIESESL